MSDFKTIERGVVNGMPYYVCERWDGWRRTFIKKSGGKKNTRRDMKWLKKQKKLGNVEVTWSTM